MSFSLFLGSAIVLLGTGTPPPSYTPGYKFNDTGGSGGGDRNSMYLPTLAAWPLSPLVVMSA